MPSDNRRRKDDTWTQDELNRALKGGSKEDRKRGDGDRRHHGEDSERRRHRDDGDEKRSRRHRDRDESPEVQLTEEDRERMRRERREKKEKGKEPKPRQKEMKPEKAVRIDDGDDDRKRRHHRKDEDERRERKPHGDEESRGHRDDRRHHDRDRERRHHDDDERRRRKEKESRHHKDGDNDDDERRRRHKEKEASSRRHDDEEDRHRRHRENDKHTSSSRRHHKDDDGQDDNDRQRRHHNGSERRRHRDGGDDEEEKERQRQERRERREREKQKEKEGDRDRERERHREDREKRSEKTSERSRDHHREDRGHDEDRDDNNDGERRSKHKSSASTPSFSVNGKHQEEEEEKQADDDYNYEEDFEDYEDDFEDEEDPEMKELRRRKNKDGEMEEVLRALDEENSRLRSNSRRSNWSDSTELSDERFKDHREEEDRRPKNVSRGKSFINFISAKQRVMDSTVASKARKRFTDLSKLIELDVARYDMFDLPPVGEYELYIRNFGRSDTKQAYVQTGDDDIEREVQTEEIESLSKWTQHPSDQDAVVGGEGIAVVSSGESVQGLLASDSERLQKFLDRVGQFLFTILDEESISSTEESRKRDGTPSASFSQSTSKLGFPQFLEGRQVKALSFCPSDPNSLLSIHSLPHETSKEEKPSSVDHLYILCIWNLSQTAYPYRICVSEMMITCACFSPTKASLVFAGMYDGSVSLWDLREPAAQHKSLEHKDDTHNVRYPTYMTAGVLEAENHKSPVKAITAVHSSVVGSLRDEETAVLFISNPKHTSPFTESSSGLSFQLASVEEKSAVNLWVVAEIPVPDPAGSENDLGLSPGGKIKLIRSSIILLNNPNKYLSYSQEIKALDLQLNPADLNHLYVTTDAGCVVHGVRFGKRAYPPAYSPLVASPVPMVTMDFSPFGQPYFLAGCQDGTLYLFHIRSEHPIAIWREFISGETILSVRWSRSRPAVFFVLDNNSNILTFDLVENGLTPVKTDNIRAADAICMEIGSDPDLLTLGVNRPAQMAFALDNGTIECLSVSDQMRKQQPLEEDFLASYIDRY